ncbi:MAG TPA: hypothetical protein VD772_01900 [Anseongella sp.]|nr:hypothetical protein [Anseongella sp.]
MPQDYVFFKSLIKQSLLGLLFSGTFALQAQNVPVKQWDKTYGSESTDNLSVIQQTTDGGYILGGYNNDDLLPSGDKTHPGLGLYDYWVVKIDAAGNKQWDKTVGGSADDRLKAVVQTPDGGYLLAGESQSGLSGHKTQPSKGYVDFWLVKLDANGNKLWDKAFGGNLADILTCMIATTDGGYLLGGYSNSTISGDKSKSDIGYYDYWVVKLDANYNKQWDKTLGSGDWDQLQTLTQTTDGGYLAGGTSSSGQFADKSEANRGLNDYWVVKLDAAGNKQWDRTFGGSNHDSFSSFVQSADGGYLLGGTSMSGISVDKS